MAQNENFCESSSWSDGYSYLPDEVLQQSGVQRPIVGSWQDPEWRFQSPEELARFILGECDDGISVADKIRLLESDRRKLKQVIQNYGEQLGWRRVEDGIKDY